MPQNFRGGGARPAGLFDNEGASAGRSVQASYESYISISGDLFSERRTEKVKTKSGKITIFNVFGLILQVPPRISMWKRLVEVFSC